MARFLTIHRQTWAAGFILATLVMVILLSQSLLAGLIFLAGTLLLALFAGGSSASRNQVRPPRDSRAHIPEEPVLLTNVITADGESHAARLVPLPQTTGHQMLLTARGYLVVDETGRVIHRI